MKSIAILSLLVAVVVAQTETEEPATTTTTTTTEAPSDGVEYGGLCNGFLLQCNRHSNTVACMHRQRNDTIGADTCETGLGVDLGRCQCSRNCDSEGVYHEDHGEFDTDRNICVGLVGALCTGLVPDCTKHATCNFLTSKCVCSVNYVPDESGLRCIPA